MRKTGMLSIAIALAMAGCGASGDEGEFQSDLTEEDERLAPEEVSERIAMAQGCALAHDKIGKFYLTMAEVEKDPAEAARFRTLAEEKLPVIEAFGNYAQGLKADYGISEEAFDASQREVTERVDSEFASREMEDFLNLMAEAADRCKEQVDAGAFD